MLGYRHAFHAGNHADVLKHIVLLDCLGYLTLKEKPLLYVDTHAGAGGYALHAGHAEQNREWEGGLKRLIEFTREERPPSAVADYLRILDEYEREYHGEYPGSPILAARALRPQDSLRLCELHVSDHEELRRRFQNEPRCAVFREDGFSFLKSVLPPPSRRGLVLIDPSYEVASDYDRTVSAVEEGINRFATGTYLIWYPLLERPESKALPGILLSLTDRPRISLELRVRHSENERRGLDGSGMVVLNPPWNLHSSLPVLLPYLARALGQAGDSAGTLEVFP